MAKVLGIGGLFFKSKNPAELGGWYEEWLGIDIDPSFGGTSFKLAALPESAYTVWSPFKEDTKYFEPSKSTYMVNFIVDDLDGALGRVGKGGATIVGEPEENEFGKFGWFLDPEGNKVELWQPK